MSFHELYAIMKRLALALLCMMLGIPAFALSAGADSLAVIHGIVVSDLEGLSVSGATAALYTGIENGQVDSLFTTTDMSGTFHFRNICPQKIRLKVFCVGKETLDGLYEIEKGSNAFYFRMKDAVEEIKSAKVVAETQLMRQIKDTVVYNTAALRTMEDENLRAVLEQLPGFRITGDEITVLGEPVKRTYVNGVLIFGDNTLAAADALKAGEVRQVRVYDEQNATDKRRGIRHGRKDRVLDIITNESLLSLAEAGVLASGGADGTGQPRYSGIAAGSLFSEMLQVDANVFADNLSKSFNGETSPSVNSALVSCSGNPLKDYREQAGGSIGLNKYWKDRQYGNSLSVKYGYTHSYGRNSELTSTEYFENSDNPGMSSVDTSSAWSKSGVHRISISTDLKDTPLKSIMFGVSGDVSNASQGSLNSASRIVESTSEEYRRHEELTSRDRICSLFAFLQWTDNDLQKCRPEYNLNVSVNENRSSSCTVDTLATSFNRRRLSSDESGGDLNVRSSLSLNGNVINNERNTLIVRGEFCTDYNRTTNSQLSLNFLDEPVPVKYIPGTWDYTWNDLSNSIEAGLGYDTDKLSLNAGLTLLNRIIDADEKSPVSYSSRHVYWCVEPRLKIKYHGYTFDLKYGSAVPSPAQTRNRVSDVNPLVLVGGNPNLRQSGRISSSNQWNVRLKGGSSVQATVSGKCGFNDIVAKTIYFSEDTVLDRLDGYVAQSGSMLCSFENARIPSWQVTTRGSWNSIHCRNKLNLKADLNADFSGRTQYLGNSPARMQELSFLCFGGLNYRPNRSARLSFSSAVGYHNALIDRRSSLSESVNLNITLRQGYVIKKNGYISMSYVFNSNIYLNDTKNFYSNVLQTTFGWKFFRKSLDLSVSGCDLLNSGSLYNTSVTANSFTRKWAPTYGRYFIFTAKYTFRNKK